MQVLQAKCDLRRVEAYTLFGKAAITRLHIVEMIFEISYSDYIAKSALFANKHTAIHESEHEIKRIFCLKCIC